MCHGSLNHVNEKCQCKTIKPFPNITFDLFQSILQMKMKNFRFVIKKLKELPSFKSTDTPVSHVFIVAI